jgi:hypothetical protein
MARWERFNLPLVCAVLLGNSGAQVRLHKRKLQNPRPSEATESCLMAQRLLR